MPTIQTGTVQLRGLAEFRRELRKLDDNGLIGQLKDTNYDIGQQVVQWARSRAATPLERRAAESLRASRNQSRAQVTFGGRKAEFAEGAEFGAIRNIPRRSIRGPVRGWNQFKEWRGNGRGAGYFLFPSIRDHEDQIVKQYGDAIEKLAAKAFPD